SYACHPTVMGHDNYRYSADYPGAARRFVEAAFRGQSAPDESALALFLPACFGDLRPHLLTLEGLFRPGTDHELQVIGRMLGSEVVHVAERIASEPMPVIAVGRREVRLPYARLPAVPELRDALEGP